MAKSKENGLWHYYPLRVDHETFERVRRLADAETKRIGRPQPVASILRQAMSLGLEKLEKGSTK